MSPPTGLMTPKSFSLYAGTVLIWGSTWLSIKYQLGEVDPMVSVTYRFAIAALMAFIFCVALRQPLVIAGKNHRFLILQGALLFGFNYWLVYTSELYLTSGLVAVLFSTFVIMNLVNGRIFLGSKISLPALIGASIGLTGVTLLFWPEVTKTELSGMGYYAIGICLLGTMFASLGNMVIARNQSAGLPALQANAWGMAYGALMLAAVSVFRGQAFNWEMSWSFNISLFYLSIFGSIAAFWLYASLIEEIGVGKAGYASLLVPVVALVLSTVAESYEWTWQALLGLVLIVGGNYMIMKKN